MKVGYVYYILCKTTEKIYIGSTTRSNSNIRKSEHFSKLKKNKHPNKHLQNSWNKYGKSNFEYGILEKCQASKVFLLEWHYVNITGCYKKEIVFNKSLVVEAPNRGKKMSEEQKKKISKKLKGRVSPMKGRKNPKAKEILKKAYEKTRKEVINLNTLEVFKSVNSFCRLNKINTTSFYIYVGKSPFKGNSFDYYDPSKIYKKIEKTEYKKKPSFVKKVLNVTTNKEFSSITEASRFYKISRKGINNCVLGKQKQCGGYFWRYC